MARAVASDELAQLDASGQAALVRCGELAPLELVEAAARRIEAHNPALNAVVTPLLERALAAARSPELPDVPRHCRVEQVKELLGVVAGDEGFGVLHWRLVVRHEALLDRVG